MLSVEDRHAIEQLYARLCWAIDSGDAAGWLDAFTVDGSFAANGQMISGHAELRPWIDARLAFRMTEPTINGQHWVTNIVGTSDGSVAHVRCYFMRSVQSRESDEVHVHATGWFEDELRMVDNEWRFHSHAVSKQMPWHFSGAVAE